MNYISDEEIQNTLDAIDNNTEKCGDLICKTTITLLKEIRNLLQSPPMPFDRKIYKHPTGNPNDVIVGKDYPDVSNP